MLHMLNRATPFQGNKQGKMKSNIFCKPFTSMILLLGFLFLLDYPKSIDALCSLKKNGTHAHCHYLDDIKFINTYELNSLRVSTVGKHLYPEIFVNLTSLKHLDLSNGILRYIEPKSFEHLYDLRSLNLSNNQLTHLQLGTLTGLKHLRALNLSKNSFKDIPLDIIELKHLKYLDLSKNNIKCDCKTLKQRDLLLKSGVEISKNTICKGLHNLNGRSFIEPDADAVCMFDEQDLDVGMQGDQPINDHVDGSGEGSDDPFDEIESDDLPEDDENPIDHSSDVNITTSAMPIEIPLTSETTTSSDDELFFTEESDKHLGTLPVTKLIETTTESTTPDITEQTETIKNNEWRAEGSGDDDAEDPWIGEGSGFEGSGIGIVPPISWDGVESKGPYGENRNVSIDEKSTLQPTSSTTTESDGIIDTLYGFFWGTSAPTIEVTTSNDLNLEEEQFIPASSTTHKPEYGIENAIDDEIIPPPIVKSDMEKNPDDVKERVLEDSKSGKVQAGNPINSTESPDASTAKQSKKGMGSYVVLAVLLGVLGALIGFAAYKGDFCKSGRKRNNDRHRSIPDLETGTELKDLTKSLLDNSNAVPTKISSSNGGKPETAPLVTSAGTPTDITNDDEPTAKYTGTLANESSVDPVKPPRKSFSPNEFENGTKNGTNGKIVTTPELSGGDGDDCSRVVYPRPMTRDTMVNGKNNRDSLSSIGGDSPSSGSHTAHLSNPRLSQGLPPASPHAQRVKITLQDNPDSVPKTPLLITRTKAGENLVKTP